MFDIGETVKQGVARAERGVSFVTVHGDRESTKAAVEPLKILAIMCCRRSMRTGRAISVSSAASTT